MTKGHGWMTVSSAMHWFHDHVLITNYTVERVHWLHAKAQFERWVEEQDSIHNEAEWIPVFFHTKSEAWRKLMAHAVHGSLKGHASYASYQICTWEELSRSAVKALSPIMEAPIKHFKVHSKLLF
jgi:hypothetical protein